MSTEETLDSTPTMKLGASIRAFRLRLNLTQSEVATRMVKPSGKHYSVSYVSAVERGQIKPSLDALGEFAKVLHTSTANLLSYQSDQELPSFALSMAPIGDYEQSVALLVKAHNALSSDLLQQALTLAKEAVKHLQIAIDLNGQDAD